MIGIRVTRLGAVSPAGWGLAPLREALDRGVPLPVQPLARPGWNRPLLTRLVPKAAHRPEFLAHPRLRRSSPISQYAVSAALEALGAEALEVRAGRLRLGVVVCVMSGCVNYSRRFYEETLHDPATASPLIFPETVFNAPASHLAAVLETDGPVTTLVGDPGTFLSGLALASDWLGNGSADAALLVGAEELDWLTVDALHRFERRMIVTAGAGALCLRRAGELDAPVQLERITESHSYLDGQSRAEAARAARAELPSCAPGHLLCDSRQSLPRFDAAEAAAWTDWSGDRLSPKFILGEGLMAAAAWQTIAAVDALERKRCAAATVSIVGCNQQAIGAHFILA